MVSANAYLGAAPVAEAIASRAQVVVTGRVADRSLFLAPAMHGFGWTPGVLDRLAAGAVMGHLLECSTQVIGDDLRPLVMQGLGRSPVNAAGGSWMRVGVRVPSG